MQKIELYRALTDVIVALTGRSTEDVIATHWRDIDDPFIWKRTRTVGDSVDPGLHKIRHYQRTHTRKSRLTERLRREVVSLRPPVSATMQNDLPVISCYADFIAAMRLHMVGHSTHALTLARRALKCAISSQDALVVLQACRVIGDILEGQLEMKEHPRLEQLQREWTAKFIDERFFAAATKEILVFHRHLENNELLALIASTEEYRDTLSIHEAGTLHHLLTDILTIRRLQVHGDNVPVARRITNILQRHRETVQPYHWVAQWLFNARLRALLASGCARAVVRVSKERISPTFEAPHLSAEYHRIRLCSYMRLGEWTNAHIEAEALKSVLMRTDDQYEHQRYLLIMGYWSICRQLGMHSEPIVHRIPRLSSFMNSFALISEDRTGLNVFVMIYEVLHLLLHDNAELADRKTFNLNVYASRNLRFDAASPLRAFITLLRAVTHFDITEPGVKARTKRHLRRMEHDVGNIPEHMISPVPLHALAEAIIQHVETRARQTRV